MVEDVAQAGATHVSVFCTGLRAAQRVGFWEERYNICVLDTVATVMWDALMLSKVDASRVTGWGKLFRES